MFYCKNFIVLAFLYRSLSYLFRNLKPFFAGYLLSIPNIFHLYLSYQIEANLGGAHLASWSSSWSDMYCYFRILMIQSSSGISKEVAHLLSYNQSHSNLQLSKLASSSIFCQYLLLPTSCDTDHLLR